MRIWAMFLPKTKHISPEHIRLTIRKISKGRKGKSTAMKNGRMFILRMCVGAKGCDGFNFRHSAKFENEIGFLCQMPRSEEGENADENVFIFWAGEVL